MVTQSLLNARGILVTTTVTAIILFTVRYPLSRYSRAVSCEEGLEIRRQKVKGILKKRNSMGEEVHR